MTTKLRGNWYICGVLKNWRHEGPILYTPILLLYVRILIQREMNIFASFILIFASVAIYGLVHSWLASLETKGWVRLHLGSTARRFYRLVYNLFAVISLLPVLALPAFLPDARLYTVPWPWSLGLLAVQAAALLALAVGVLQTGVWSFLGLRQAVSGMQERPRLVKQGLYRWVRHPLYSAGMAFIWAVPIMTFNLLALNLSLTAYLIAGAVVEERKLLQEFGEAYARYRERTPMFIPKFER